MKCLIVLAAVLAVGASAVTSFRGFASASASSSVFPRPSASKNFAVRPAAPVVKAPVAAVVSRGSSPDATAEIVRYDNDFSPDGSYHYYYETNNGITGQQNGTPKSLGGNPPLAPVVAEGSYAYTAPGGQVVSISYVADENGYQPQGEVLPTPPPVPAQIARALEWIQAHPYTEPK